MCALGGYGLTEGNSGENRRGLRGWLSLGRWGVSRRGRKGPHGRGERMWMGIYTPPAHPESLPLDSVPRESRAVTGHAPGSRGKPRAIAPCSPCFAQAEVSGASCATTCPPRLWLRLDTTLALLRENQSILELRASLLATLAFGFGSPRYVCATTTPSLSIRTRPAVFCS